MSSVSVIIPVYNAENTLRKCVESIVFGTYRAFEVLLVEDHSSDSSWQLCQELEAQFESVRVMQNDCNRGVSYTRNRGLEASNGEYICFVDSDDWVSADFLQTFMELSTVHKDAILCCGYTKCYTVSKQKYNQSTNAIDIIEKNDLFDILDKELIQYIWNKCFRSDIIKTFKLKFDEKQYMGEDFQFVIDYMNAAKCWRFCIYNDSLYFYSQTSPKSLVSRWSNIENYNEAVHRLKQLCLITGNEHLESIKINQLNNTFIYLIARDKKRNIFQRIRDIKFFVGNRNAFCCYITQRWLLTKERISTFIQRFRLY